jgi:uncharacterized protein
LAGRRKDAPAILALRLAYRVIWVNPLKSDARYKPVTRGMRAVLSHVHLLVSGHNLASLAALAAVLEALD